MHNQLARVVLLACLRGGSGQQGTCDASAGLAGCLASPDARGDQQKYSDVPDLVSLLQQGTSRSSGFSLHDHSKRDLTQAEGVSPLRQLSANADTSAAPLAPRGSDTTMGQLGEPDRAQTEREGLADVAFLDGNASVVREQGEWWRTQRFTWYHIKLKDNNTCMESVERPGRWERRWGKRIHVSHGMQIVMKPCSDKQEQKFRFDKGVQLESGTWEVRIRTDFACLEYDYLQAEIQLELPDLTLKLDNYCEDVGCHKWEFTGDGFVKSSKCSYQAWEGKAKCITAMENVRVMDCMEGNDEQAKLQKFYLEKLS